MRETASSDPSAPGRSLTLFPADDRRFRDAAILAVELFAPGADGRDSSSPPRPVDDERLLAAAQAMLRAAYPLATIVGDPGPDVAASPVTVWQVFRDPASLDDRLLRAARSGHADAMARLADRYQAIAFLITWTICGETTAAMAAVTDAVGQLVRSDELVDGEDVADRLLRLARRAALARRKLPAADEDDHWFGARIRLSSMLARLPASQATGLSLAYGEGLSEVEVALAVGLDEGLTRMLIRDGLAVLVDGPTYPGGR